MLVPRIGEKMGIDVQGHYISISHRLPSSRKKIMAIPDYVHGLNPIIVKFTNRKVRKDWGLASPWSKLIYIAKSLTQKIKELFYRCANFKQENEYQLIWTQIYLRKDHESSKTHVSSLNDLDKLDRQISHNTNFFSTPLCN